MHAVYHYNLGWMPPELRASLGAIPGVNLRGQREVFAPANAAWLVEEECNRFGVKFAANLTGKMEDGIKSIDELLSRGLREWVPSFLTAYQREGIVEMSRRSGMLLWAAGSGKTLGGVCWALGNGGATVVVTRAAVRRAYGREIERFTEHRAYVIEDTGPMDAERLESSMFVVLGWETLPYHIDALLKWKPTNVIFDECFPGDTLVATPTGPRRIDSLLPGDTVLSVDAQGQVCQRAVTRTIAKRLTVPLVRVTHETGSFVCTANHKVWTEEEGYVEAGRLDVRHHLRVVCVGDGDSDSSAHGPTALLQSVMQREVAHGAAAVQGGVVEGREGRSGEGWVGGALAGAGVSGADSAAHDGVESDGQSGDRGEHGGSEAGQAVSGLAWWEWRGDDRATGHDLSRISVAGRRVLRWSSGVDSSGNWRSAVLARLGDAGTEAGYRSGRGFASDEEGPQPGCPQGPDTRGARVVAVARVERGSDGTVGGDAGEGAVVFDLEVEGTHNYFAAGVLVSNCHKAKSNKRFEAVPRQDGSLSFQSRDNIAYHAYTLSRGAKYRLGTTATPIKDRTRDLWAQLDICQPDAWGPFYRHDRPSFTGRYCAARRNAFGGVDTTGASNLDELWNRVSLAVHQVPYSVTHRDLPQRRRVVTFIPTSEQSAPSGGFAKELAKASKTGKTAILEVRLAEAASRKRAAVVERIEECVEVGQKVLVFTGRRNDCDKLTEAVKKAVGEKAQVYSGHGGTTAKERDGIQQAYMADPGPCVLVGTGDAWGEGVNLQDTDTFLVVMLPFTPGQVVQWEGRVARHGQKRPVLIEYMVAENTVDEHVGSILLDKLPAVEEVAKDDSVVGFADSLAFGDKTEDEIVDSVLAMLGVV